MQEIVVRLYATISCILDADNDSFILPLFRKEFHADGLAVFPCFLLSNGEGEQWLWIGNVAVEHGINRSISPLRMIGLSGNFAGGQIPYSLRNIHREVQRPVKCVVIHNNHLQNELVNKGIRYDGRGKVNPLV